MVFFVVVFFPPSAGLCISFVVSFQMLYKIWFFFVWWNLGYVDVDVLLCCLELRLF